MKHYKYPLKCFKDYTFSKFFYVCMANFTAKILYFISENFLSYYLYIAFFLNNGINFSYLSVLSIFIYNLSGKETFAS